MPVFVARDRSSARVRSARRSSGGSVYSSCRMPPNRSKGRFGKGSSVPYSAGLEVREPELLARSNRWGGRLYCQRMHVVTSAQVGTGRPRTFAGVYTHCRAASTIARSRSGNGGWSVSSRTIQTPWTWPSGPISTAWSGTPLPRVPGGRSGNVAWTLSSSRGGRAWQRSRTRRRAAWIPPRTAKSPKNSRLRCCSPQSRMG
jgi:hypothetical protein